MYNFIEDVSEKLNDNGIFYFDIFNSLYFENNEPKISKRNLNENVFYFVNPAKFQKYSDYTFLKLENYVSDNDVKYEYNLNIFIWKLDLIIDICQRNNLVLVKNRMLGNETDIENYHKISLIFKKKKRIDLLP